MIESTLADISLKYTVGCCGKANVHMLGGGGACVTTEYTTVRLTHTHPGRFCGMCDNTVECSEKDLVSK